MDNKSKLEWKSENSLNLMQVLARDNGEFLYNDLTRIGYYRLPIDPNNRDDLMQDFFIEITGRAKTYRYNIEPNKEIDDDPKLKSWVVNSFLNYCFQYRTKSMRRLPKRLGQERTVEINLDRIVMGNLRLVDPKNFRLDDDWYRLCDKTKYVSENGLIEEEYVKDRKLERMKKAINWGVSQLTPDRKEAMKLYYFGNLSTKEIGDKLGKSIGSVKTLLYDARKDLIDILPYYVREEYKDAA